MNKLKTLQEALALVPEYILLRPEEKSCDGDEFFNDQSDAWQVIEPCDILSGYLPRRRPIPQKVREAMAEAMLAGMAADAGDALFRECYPFESWLASQGGNNA